MYCIFPVLVSTRTIQSQPGNRKHASLPPSSLPIISRHSSFDLFLIVSSLTQVLFQAPVLLIIPIFPVPHLASVSICLAPLKYQLSTSIGPRETLKYLLVTPHN